MKPELMIANLEQRLGQSWAEADLVRAELVAVKAKLAETQQRLEWAERDRDAAMDALRDERLRALTH